MKSEKVKMLKNVVSNYLTFLNLIQDRKMLRTDCFLNDTFWDMHHGNDVGFDLIDDEWINRNGAGVVLFIVEDLMTSEYKDVTYNNLQSCKGMSKQYIAYQFNYLILVYLLGHYGHLDLTDVDTVLGITELTEKYTITKEMVDKVENLYNKILETLS